MSCNGCRVLRKGCSDGCILRQCLRWIESPDAQGHATVFVAKFFGRAGMMALITSVPDHQRPALFQSLLYEACGRTINPVFGAVGLLCSGNWKLCQDAVDTVMKGGLLCQSSTGTGRPGTGFLPPQSLIPSASGRLSKVRLGRGYVNTATGAPFSAANNINNYNNKAKSVTNFVTGRDLSLDSSTFAGTAGAVLKKREMDHDTGNPHALKQQRVGSFKVEARDEKEADEREDEQPQPQQQQQQQQQQLADGDEDRECKWKTSRSGHRNACMGRKFQESDSVVDCSRRPQDVEEVGLGLGLDLTLGSSSSAWKTMSSNRRGHRQQQLVVKRTTPGSPCHSSEADSDTTDLSISIQSQVDTVASAAAAAAKALPTPSTPPPTGEVLRSSINNDLLLMDLLH